MAETAGRCGCWGGGASCLGVGGRGKLCSCHSSLTAPRLCLKSGPSRQGGEARLCGAALSRLLPKDPAQCLAFVLVCSASLCPAMQEGAGSHVRGGGGVRVLRPRHLVRRLLQHASTNTAAPPGPCLHAFSACPAAPQRSQQRPAAWSLGGRSVSRESEERCAQ